MASHKSQFHNSYRTLTQALRHCGLCLCLMLPASLFAQDNEDKSVKTWIDSPVTLPAPPAAENLLRFYTNDNQSFFIDSKSLSIAADGSLRYTLVSKSQSGAKNVSYEGLRCDSNQKRLFAFGRADGTWSKSRRDEWDAFGNSGLNKQHSTLAWDFACDGGAIAGNVDRILQRIRLNQSLRQYH